MRRVLTLTRAAYLFEKLGFQEKAIEEFPLKVRRDCRPCPFRHCCDEVALLYLIDGEEGGAR
jgi:argininosuccinate lyase/amino-acid N-acetyltransferase